MQDADVGPGGRGVGGDAGVVAGVVVRRRVHADPARERRRTQLDAHRDPANVKVGKSDLRDKSS